MRSLKVILIIIAVVLLVVVGALVGVYTYADSLIVMGVEKAGTSSIGSETNLQEADLSLFDGSLILHNLNVANPEGYNTPHLLELGSCETAVDINSLTTDTIKVKNIFLRDMVITLESKGLKSNLQVTLDQIKEISQKDKTDPEQPEEEKPPAKKRVLVEQIQIVEPVAMIKLTQFATEADVMKVRLGTITLKEISSEDKQGALMGQVFQQVIVSLAAAIVNTGIDLPGNILKGLKGSVEGLTDVIGVTAQGFIEGGGKFLEGGVNIVEGVGKSAVEIISAPFELLNPDKKPKDPCKATGAETIIKGTGDILEGGGKAIEGIGRGILELGKTPGKALEATKDKKEQEDKKQQENRQ